MTYKKCANCKNSKFIRKGTAIVKIKEEKECDTDEYIQDEIYEYKCSECGVDLEDEI